MTTVKVKLFAFGDDGKVTREVDIPSEIRKDKITLDDVFYYGQNDFQPKQCRSVSVGDVIEFIDGESYRVEGIGFSKVIEGR